MRDIADGRSIRSVSDLCWRHADRGVARNYRAQSGTRRAVSGAGIFSAAALWILLRAEFLAIALVLVYVGAVMVLFLFVVMMLDINIDKLRRGFWRNAPWGFGVAALIVLQMWLVLSQPQWQGMTRPGPGIAMRTTRARWEC